MIRHVAANAITLLIVALVMILGLIGWGQRSFTGPGPLAEAMCLRVERGATLNTISNRLEEQGAISNAALFRIGARYTERAGGLRFGAYLIEAGASMDDILETITTPGPATCGTEVQLRVGVARSEFLVRELDPATQRMVELVRFDIAQEERPEEFVRISAEADTRFRVTVVEGTTVWQVIEALRAADFLEGDPGPMPLEGMLAPDSYEVRRGFERAALVAEMQARQERILAAEWERRAEGLPISTPEEAMILASIIEKETSIDAERLTVASVFVNRLRRGMRLQTDPTVIYGVTEGRGVLGRAIRQSDLRDRNAWNTYVIDGLPPTPIANPGRDSIRAALNPDETEYIFFVADGTGGHTFTRTLAEHNAAVRVWREIEAERRRNATE